MYAPQCKGEKKILQWKVLSLFTNNSLFMLHTCRRCSIRDPACVSPSSSQPWMTLVVVPSFCTILYKKIKCSVNLSFGNLCFGNWCLVLNGKYLLNIEVCAKVYKINNFRFKILMPNKALLIFMFHGNHPFAGYINYIKKPLPSKLNKRKRIFCILKCSKGHY